MIMCSALLSNPHVRFTYRGTHPHLHTPSKRNMQSYAHRTGGGHRHPIDTWQRRFKPNLLLHIQKSETLCACATQPTTPRGADMCSYKFLLYLLIYNSLCISVRPPTIEQVSAAQRMNWHRGLLAPSPPDFRLIPW